jgi:hypothetical protein
LPDGLYPAVSPGWLNKLEGNDLRVEGECLRSAERYQEKERAATTTEEEMERAEIERRVGPVCGLTMLLASDSIRPQKQ